MACAPTVWAQGDDVPEEPPVELLDPTFFNWETPTVDPMAITPNGDLLLVVNLPDHHLEVFDIRFGTPIRLGSVPVGLDPVTVTARSDDEAWVVNHVSDSISVVDLNTLTVTRTIQTEDEPCDVVFAGSPTRAFVSISQRDGLQVFDPDTPDTPPAWIPIDGREPRDLATDGQRVYVGIFESGNRSTVLSEELTSAGGNPYPGDQNPPPNSGSIFRPALAEELPNPPRLGMVVKQASNGAWLDDNAGTWSGSVTWGLHDHDIAEVDSRDFSIRYTTDVAHLVMALSVRPDGTVFAVGTNSVNQVRYLSNLNGRFLRVGMIRVDFDDPAGHQAADLNPHLTYQTASVPESDRAQSVATPRAIVWSADGTRAYIAGMGSNNVTVVDSTGMRLAQTDVGAGPAGLALDSARDRLYVLDRFDGTITTIDTLTNGSIGRTHLFDPTPQWVRDGRRALYDARAFSGTGHVSCASCHADARRDGLAWDLGDPAGRLRVRDGLCDDRLPDAGGCGVAHPMKGPLRTLSLVGSLEAFGLNARAEAPDLHAIADKYTDLLGADEAPAPETIDALDAFLRHISRPPHPNRAIDGTLPAEFTNGGDPRRGETLFETLPALNGVLSCAECHADGRLSGETIIPPNVLAYSQGFRVPSLQMVHEELGFDPDSNASRRGFGLGHDGSLSSVLDYLFLPRFDLDAQQALDLEAYVLCIGTETFAGIGAQATVGGVSGTTQLARAEQLIQIALAGEADLIVRGTIDGEPRGALLNRTTGRLDSDRAGESFDPSALLLRADDTTVLTATLVPPGTGVRLALDRDQDGIFNTDERDVCTNPADPIAVPGGAFSPDQNGDGIVDLNDLRQFITSWLILEGDYDRNGEIDLVDLLIFLTEWFSCSP